MSKQTDAPAKRPFQVVIVEDSPTDAQLTREALNACEAACVLHHLTDGVELMQFLRRDGDHAGSPRPDLVLLDLNMPKMDGSEVLKAVKNDEQLKSIPFIVLSTSNAHDDVARAYRLHANSYIVKPMDFGHFVDVMRGMVNFWFRIASLPREPEK